MLTIAFAILLANPLIAKPIPEDETVTEDTDQSSPALNPQNMPPPSENTEPQKITACLPGYIRIAGDCLCPSWGKEIDGKCLS